MTLLTISLVVLVFNMVWLGFNIYFYIKMSELAQESRDFSDQARANVERASKLLQTLEFYKV